ncbi:MAG TPA: lipid A-modifier LpxR family protein, partial [Gemmatimonadaceae bacterium]|nr:lipid A-modifier LpxR family protein [Gemmatimonadaceae bacterium]
AGFTGTPSLGQPVQVGFHHIFGFKRPLGWKNQLATEAAFALKAEQFWRVAPDRIARFADVVPVVGVSIGTLRTAAKAGGRVRLGNRLDHPWLALRSRNGVTVQGFVGGHVEGVARDLFLDGNTFRNSLRVDGEPLRAEWERGIHIGVRRLAVEYAVVTQGREYRTGPLSHTYATLAVEWTMNARKF